MCEVDDEAHSVHLPNEFLAERGKPVALLLIIALIVALAVAGGVVVSKFLFLILLVALVLAAFGLFSRGTA